MRRVYINLCPATISASIMAANMWKNSLKNVEPDNNKILYETLTYLLTPWCRILLEKLTGLQLVKKLPAFHGTRRFITALTSFRHLSLSWASPIQSIYTHPTSWRSILILSVNLRLVGPCHHGMARPQVADRETASDKEGSCE